MAERASILAVTSRQTLSDSIRCPT